jgi:hypothetical protein
MAVEIGDRIGLRRAGDDHQADERRESAPGNAAADDSDK